MSFVPIIFHFALAIILVIPFRTVARLISGAHPGDVAGPDPLRGPSDEHP